MTFYREGNIAFPLLRRYVFFGSTFASAVLYGGTPKAYARTLQENYVELQAFRYSASSIKLDNTKTAGGSESFKLSESSFAIYPNRVTFVGHGGGWAFQLTRAFNEGGSGYLSAGYVFNEFFEAGLGANLLWRDYERLDEKNRKYEVNANGYFFGPYVLATMPAGFGEIELRWEIDYGLARENRKSAGMTSKMLDARGYETDFDARFVFRASPKLSFTIGANVFYKSVVDKAPFSVAYTKTKRTDLTFGLNLLGARFSF